MLKIIYVLINTITLYMLDDTLHVFHNLILISNLDKMSLFFLLKQFKKEKKYKNHKCVLQTHV